MCGPESIGVKSEMCQGGVYTEMAGCAFDPAKDYSCYSIPSVVGNPICGDGMPQASAPCMVPDCTLCNSQQGLPGGTYLDSSGALKVGYCVCSAPGGSAPKWSCAADTSWPCPGSAGCRSVTGSGGSIGIGGAPGGTGGTGGAGGSSFGGDPQCPSTVAKGGACGPTDLQFCYKTCGPQKLGVKSETCTTAGTYAEMSGCNFDPGRDYSCFAIAAQANPACPAAPPQAATACDVPACTVCNSMQGLSGGGYVDSAGAAKVGFCVCQPPDATGTRTWSCASDTQWPCPLGAGCNGTGAGGSGGAAGAGGGGGAAGTGGAGGGSSFGQPACPGTVAKAAACAPTDVQFCYKVCGPEKTGVKSETCQTNGIYAEMSGCMFDPTRDYSCYKLPAIGNAACGANSTPINGSTCDVAACSVCNSLEGTPGGGYLDSSGAAKVGYCVCQAPNSAGMRTWSCASDTAWPCPGGSGC
jgi:hypothetical protein